MKSIPNADQLTTQAPVNVVRSSRFESIEQLKAGGSYICVG